MMSERTLFTMAAGAESVVSHVEVLGCLRRRLMDLGFVPGASVRFLYAAPCGDPRAYWVRGCVIALRAGDAQHVQVV